MCGPAHRQTELSGPMAESRMLGHGQAMSRQSPAPKQTPWVWSDWIEPGFPETRSCRGSDNPGCCFQGPRFQKAASCCVWKPGGGAVTAETQISVGNIWVLSEMLKIVFFLTSPFFNLTLQSSFLNTYLIQAVTIKIIFITHT